MKLSQIAYEAARIASERGHCKGIEQDEDGHVCLVGAINLALAADQPGVLTSHGTIPPSSSPLRSLQHELLHYVGKVLQGMGVHVWNVTFLDEAVPRGIDWNNLPETSGEDVVLVLKKTAELLEAEE